MHVNGVQLHSLDWGGTGEVLLFLSGLGGTAHDFDRIAPRFVDHVRALGLTRRGHGESDWPATGYELDTLVEDIRQFMDALEIEKASLAGHSFGGVELTRFTELYPERVARLIYLDAVYDPAGRKDLMMANPVFAIPSPVQKSEFESLEAYVEHTHYHRPDLAAIWCEPFETQARLELELNAAGRYVEKDFSRVAGQALESVTAYDHRRAPLRVPVLWISAIAKPVLPPYLTAEQSQAAQAYHRDQWLPYQQREIAQFRAAVPQAHIIQLPNSHHYCFISDEDLVYQEMRHFLEDTQ